MKRAGQFGLTLIETLVSIAVMTILLATAYATIEESMKLHKGFFQDAARITQRCDFAEQVTTDFRFHRAVREASARRWTVTRADGATVEYSLPGDKAIRELNSGETTLRKSYDVGRVTVSFLVKGAQWSDAPPRGKEPLALRLQFSDSELIVAR